MNPSTLSNASTLPQTPQQMCDKPELCKPWADICIDSELSLLTGRKHVIPELRAQFEGEYYFALARLVVQNRQNKSNPSETSDDLDDLPDWILQAGVDCALIPKLQKDDKKEFNDWCLVEDDGWTVV